MIIRLVSVSPQLDSKFNSGRACVCAKWSLTSATAVSDPYKKHNKCWGNEWKHTLKEESVILLQRNFFLISLKTKSYHCVKDKIHKNILITIRNMTRAPVITTIIQIALEGLISLIS